MPPSRLAFGSARASSGAFRTAVAGISPPLSAAYSSVPLFIALSVIHWIALAEHPSEVPLRSHRLGNGLPADTTMPEDRVLHALSLTGYPKPERSRFILTLVPVW